MSISLGNASKKDIELDIKLDIEEKSVIVKVYTHKSEDNQIKNLMEKVIEKTELSDTKKVSSVKNCSFSIGVVAYLEPDKYKFQSDSIDELEVKNLNEEIHIPFAPDIYPKIFAEIYSTLTKTEVKKVVIGHEHGKENNKCHLQICISFKKRITTQLYPGKLEFDYEGETIVLLFMQQKTRNVYALENYCKKEKDFATFESDPISLVANDKGKVQAFATIVRNKGVMSAKEIEELLFKYEPRTMFVNYKNILSVLPKFANETDIPDFQWVLPKHLDDFLVPRIVDEKEQKVKFMPIFLDWFNNYCVCTEVKRKKALCLYSKQRALGKTEFAKSLVNDSKYLLMFSNTFTTFDESDKKLLLLDDMANITKDAIEMWKNLIAGSNTTIRGCYVNQPYTSNLPCIITTNNKEMVYLFASNSMFNTQIVLIEITDYMGPPNTKPEKLFEQEVYVSKELLTDIKINEDIQDYIEEKKRKRFSK